MFEPVILLHYFQYGSFKFKQNDHIQQIKRKPLIATALNKTYLIENFD